MLALVAVALALAPAAGAQPVDVTPGGQLDPSPSQGVLAYTQRDGEASSVVVRVSAGNSVEFPGASAPSLSGDLVAFVDDSGVRVVHWRFGGDVARLPGAESPALAWPGSCTGRRPWTA